MKNRNRNKIIPQMFDVRPVNNTGDLDLEKIKKIKKILHLEKKFQKNKTSKKIIIPKKDFKILQLEKKFDSKNVPFRHEFNERDFLKNKEFTKRKKEQQRTIKKSKPIKQIKEKKRVKLDFWMFKKNAFQFGMACVLVLLLTLTPVIIGKGLGIKNRSLENSKKALTNLVQAKEDFSNFDFESTIGSLEESQEKFEDISCDIDELGYLLIEAGKFIPGISKITSGKYLAEAGKKATEIGIIASETAATLDQLKNPISKDSDVSLLEIFQKTNSDLEEILELTKGLENDLKKINLNDLPENKREVFVTIKNQLPEINSFITSFIEESQILNDILGGKGPRKYLFLFQNNHEMRATGGFIGTYALLDIFNGRIKKLTIDGIFNPDGQLKEKVVPPAPIQKISAAWSLHDSNWWPNFPTSAEKAIWFWEKTGGPTVDGVITMTPQVLKSFLEITGPIEMPAYGKTINKDNFTQEVQQEVEVEYDKDLNQPKKILSDLAPKLLDKIFNTKNPKKIVTILRILGSNLDQKHILLYSTNYNIQKLIKEKGFSGEVLETQKDYLSVINTNINGYKTDGVIKEDIQHEAQIFEDGSIIDTLTIKRHHTGGNSQYEWFNKVNANYQRVYLPKGSKLISATGQTREFNEPPLDYNALSFKKDPQVMIEEQNMHIDEKTGTRIYEEGNKTIFANWNYVSPQETSVMKYTYQLPFKIDLSKLRSGIDTYSLVAQKQAGSIGTTLNAKVIFPESWKINWKYPESNFKKNNNNLNFTSNLEKDRFIGIAFEKKYD